MNIREIELINEVYTYTVSSLEPIGVMGYVWDGDAR